MADFTTEALAAEIQNDPLAIGYKNGDGTWKGDQEIADLLNAKNYTGNKEIVSTADLRAAVTYDAFDGLTAAEESYLRFICMGESIAVNADTLKTFAAIGGSSIWATADKTVMEPRMVALMQYSASRAEVLWGEGFQVGPGMVGQAANV